MSRWTSWAVRPNELSGFRGRKDLLNRASALVTTCPNPLALALSATAYGNSGVSSTLQPYWYTASRKLPTEAVHQYNSHRNVSTEAHRYTAPRNVPTNVCQYIAPRNVPIEVYRYIALRNVPTEVHQYTAPHRENSHRGSPVYRTAKSSYRGSQVYRTAACSYSGSPVYLNTTVQLEQLYEFRIKKFSAF